MFDIGFWELMIIGLVALLVVGPERLPKLAYSAGKWVSKGRAMLATVKGQIDKEMKSEELRQILKKQKEEIAPLQEIIEETTGTMHGFAADAKEVVHATDDPQGSDGASDDRRDGSADTDADALGDNKERPRV